jgi:aryl-alcohol dehydrogenase-like predicted oxidoreductase
LKYRLLGKSGLRVSEAALGTMTFGDELRWGSPKAAAQKVYETYREAGGNFVDTAKLLHWRHERKIRGWVHQRPSRQRRSSDKNTPPPRPAVIRMLQAITART